MTARISPKLAAELAAYREAKANRPRRRKPPKGTAQALIAASRASGATSAEVAELVARMKAAAATKRDQLAAERKAVRIARQYEAEAERRARRAADAARQAEQLAARMAAAEVRRAERIAAREASDERLAARVRRVRVGSQVLEYQVGGDRAEWMAHLRAIRAAHRAEKGV
jgi:hypothetical protein